MLCTVRYIYVLIKSDSGVFYYGFELNNINCYTDFLCMNKYGTILLIGVYVIWFILGDLEYFGLIKAALLVYIIMKIADVSNLILKEKAEKINP